LRSALIVSVMKKISFAIVLFSISFSSFAALGPDFEFHQRPHSVCAIEFYVGPEKEKLSEVCSAVVIGPKLMLSAAHCTPNLLDRPYKIICRNEVNTQIVQTIKNENVQLDQLRFSDDKRKYDTALLTLSHDITTPNMEVVSTREKTEKLLDETNQCGIFGFGGFHHQDRQKGHSTSAKLAPSQIEFDGDLIRVNGHKARAVGLVEPGDSGGSLACLNPESKRWVHIAQVSGRTMQGISLFAPTYLFHDQLKKYEALNLDDQGEELKEEWQKNDELLATQRCQKVLERSGATDIQVDDYNSCKQLQENYLRDEFRAGRQIKTRLQKFTLVELDQHEGMIQLSNQRDASRLLQSSNPFSTVDHTFNQFAVTKIEGDTVTGDLKIFGYSDNFGCFENILCEGGDFKNVKVSISDLALPLLK